AELHGRRAVQQRQRPVSEVVLPDLPLVGWDLCGVFLCVQAGETKCDLTVEIAEEGVDPRYLLGVQAPAQWIVCTLSPVSANPANRSGLQPVAGDAVRVSAHLGQGSDLVQHVEEVEDDLQRLLGGEVATKSIGAT